MSLAFNARQKIDLPVKENFQRLPDYLLQQERVVGAMLDSKKLDYLGEGNFRYRVTSFKVFQLEVNPVVSIAVKNSEGNKLQMHATDSELDGLGLVDDFELMLDATLIATETGLNGEAFLGVSVSQPPLLRLIPPKILESTGQSILNGILLGIKARVGKQLISDFEDWCKYE
ncbi:DUF1997 domain-containing protein [Prochlorococcus marinus]|uniref:DUF1997 domain-containing protein n=1 Tax=Prochlorococcus marinus TaxID=1219 RepID=UPI0022B514D0|nr:DUF1997 domain-containing protein [Prochlorococcus marinus]